MLSGVYLRWLKQLKPEYQRPFSLLKLGMRGVTLPSLKFIAFCSIVLLVYLKPSSVTLIFTVSGGRSVTWMIKKTVVFPEILEKNHESRHSG